MSNALNIVVTNDDGFEASTIHALYRVLKEHGHSVVIVSEVQDNRGKGGGADFFKPIGPLTQDSRAGSVHVGALGTGVLETNSDVHYIDGTPRAWPGQREGSRYPQSRERRRVHRSRMAGSEKACGV